MSNDITALMATMKAAAEKATEFGEERLYVKAGNVLALVEALETEQQKSAKQGSHACELFDEVKQLQEQLRTVELSNSVLESRTVTVKRVGADQMHRVCLEATRHLDKYAAMAREVNKLLGSPVTNATAAQLVTVKLPEVRITVAESKRKNLTWRELGAYNEGADVAAEKISKVLVAAGIQVIEGGA